MKFINVPIFIISLAIGLFICYITTSKTEVIFVYTTPDNIDKILYKDYKTKEYEIRNKINFEKILVSNFIEINKDTVLDFKNNNQNFKEVFIKFTDSSSAKLLVFASVQILIIFY